MAGKSLCVAAIRRTSTLCVRLLPSLSNSCSCRTRSSFAWSSRGISPTSSRNRVPLSASSNRPVFWAIAPVNAPFSWPKSSLSRRPRGIAAQFSFTNAFSLRRPSLWIARATSSLPVPVSPRISTPESVGATTDTMLNAVFNAWLSPTISPNSARISSSR
jgi:hypothetical protein